MKLTWTSDGALLYVLARRRLYVLDSRLQRVSVRRFGGGEAATDMALSPDDRTVALVLRRGHRSHVQILHKGRVFSGAGRFGGLEWSPNGRWLLVAWKEANQWVFIRSTSVRRIRAVSRIESQFGSRSFPELRGWCCAPRP
jgi:hypothetical protein